VGMFSWCCKGCEHELCVGEYVRLGMHKEEYDGYGGSYEVDYEPVAWHQACYEAASTEEKLDETPSKPAPNQGFGSAKLAFKEGYDPKAPTTYTAVVYGSHSDRATKKYTRYQFLLTPNGLEDEIAYDAGLEAFAEQYYKDNPPPEGVYKRPLEEMNAYFEKHHAIIVAQYGSSPESRQLTFSTIEDCIKMVEEAIETFLPAVLTGVYTLTIFGTQGEITGAVYVRTANAKWEKKPDEWNELGVKCEKWEKLPGIETHVVYMHGVHAPEDSPWD
jgi:hypothetical protein